MDNSTCDMCGKMLLADEDTRYIVRIEVFAAYDPLELTAADIATDRAAELARLLEVLKNTDAETLEAQVYKSFRFDLCPVCQKKYLAQPLPAKPSAETTP